MMMITTENSGGDARYRVISGLNGYINGDPAVREFVSAYIECDSYTREVVKKMIAIIRDKSADKNEIELAQETVVEALFPDLMSDYEYECESDRETARSRVVKQELDREEAEFADRVRALMEQHGITQEKLATATGVSQPAISHILDRVCRPSRSTVAKFAKALGVKPDDLWPV